jgi:hypothetical protein
MPDIHSVPTHRVRCLAFAILALGLAAASSTPVLAAPEEDSLVCAKVKDSYAENAYVAAFWPRSETYGDMSWCSMKVRAVEHCVPAETILHNTSAPYEGYRGPELQAEYTCYKIRCTNGDGDRFMGESVPIGDTFGARMGDAPQVVRVCLPNP